MRIREQYTVIVGFLSMANNALNQYGGLIGVTSLLFSVFVFFRTGRIIKSIETTKTLALYQKQRTQSAKKFKSFALSIVKDDIFDSCLKGEILQEIALLNHYSSHIGIKTNISLIRLQYLISRWDRKEKIADLLNSLAGDLSAKEYHFQKII